jgi:hypothetical protein
VNISSTILAKVSPIFSGHLTMTSSAELRIGQRGGFLSVTHAAFHVAGLKDRRSAPRLSINPAFVISLLESMEPAPVLDITRSISGMTILAVNAAADASAFSMFFSD